LFRTPALDTRQRYQTDRELCKAGADPASLILRPQIEAENFRLKILRDRERMELTVVLETRPSV